MSKPKKRFVCAYAYDVSGYADFIVEAVDEKAAQRQINKALRAGSFNNVNCELNWDSMGNHRAWVQVEVNNDSDYLPMMKELEGFEDA